MDEKIKKNLDLITKKFGKDSATTLKEVKKIDSVSTGSFSLDRALGVGGFPKGTMIEIFGNEGVGKTTLGIHAIKEAQKAGKVAVYIDVEHTFNPKYAQKLGVELDKLIFSQPDNGEDALNLVQELITKGDVGVIVLDSVAGLNPKDEIGADIEQTAIGKRARLLSTALPKLTAPLQKSKTLFILINQVRQNINTSMFAGDPTTTPGGKALKFYSSVRIKLERIKQIKLGEKIVGGRIRAKIIKNKVAIPFVNAEYDLIFGEGISEERGILEEGVKRGIIAKNGAYLTIYEEKIQGTEKAVQHLKDNPKIIDKLVKELDK